MCEGCLKGEHWNCGMQTWCKCNCDPEMPETWYPIIVEPEPKDPYCAEDEGSTDGC